MYDNGSIPEAPTPYGELPEHLTEEAHKMCEGKTIDDLRKLSDYFGKKASDMSREMEKTLTMEDFEKAKTRAETEDY